MQLIFDVSGNVLKDAAKRILVVAKNDKIIHVAHIILNAQPLFNEMIQLVQVNIGPYLRGQAADGQACVVTWAIDDDID